MDNFKLILFHVLHSLLLGIPLALVGGLYIAISAGVLDALGDNWTVLILLFGLFYLLLYIFSKLVAFIWRGMKFMYHFYMIILVIVAYSIYFNDWSHRDNFWMIYIVMEFTILFFLVPEMQGAWQHYVVTTYIDDIEVERYFTSEYTSGTAAKFGAMVLGTFVFSLFSLLLGKVGLIISFVIHLLYLVTVFVTGLLGFIKEEL